MQGTLNISPLTALSGLGRGLTAFGKTLANASRFPRFFRLHGRSLAVRNITGWEYLATRDALNRQDTPKT